MANPDQFLWMSHSKPLQNEVESTKSLYKGGALVRLRVQSVVRESDRCSLNALIPIAQYVLIDAYKVSRYAVPIQQHHLPEANMKTNLRAEPESISFDPSKSALCVIDMQNYDIKPGGFFDLTGVDTEHGKRVIEPIKKAIAYSKAASIPIIYTRMVIAADPLMRPGEDSPWYWKGAAYRADISDPAMERAIGIDGTWGAEIVDELAPQEGDYIVTKPLYSAFQRTDFDLILKRLGVRHLFITGIGTPTCVEATARDAYFQEYFPVLLEDCCGGIIPETHGQALVAIKRRYGWVSDLESWASSLSDGIPDFRSPV